MIMNALTAVAFLHPDPPEKSNPLTASDPYHTEYNATNLEKVTKDLKVFAGLTGAYMPQARS
jgi:hypothetical protein